MLPEEKKNQIEYISLAEAVKGSPYSQEYLSLLVRTGKISAKKIGRNWYTTKRAVEDYIDLQKVKSRIRDGVNLKEILSAGKKGVGFEGFPRLVQPKAQKSQSRLKTFSKIFPSIIWNSSLVLSTLVVFLFLGLFVSNLFQESRLSGIDFSKPHLLLGDLLLDGAPVLNNLKTAFQNSWSRSKNDFKNFAAVAGEQTGFLENLSSKVFSFSKSISDSLYEIVFGVQRIEDEKSVLTSRETGESSSSPELAPAPAPVFEKEITRIREVIETKETFVPADLAVVKKDILSTVGQLNLAIQLKFNQAMDDLRSSLSRTSGRTESAIQMVTLTQKIDTLDSIQITNGVNIISGGIDITKGNIVITEGNITADTIIARSGFSVSGNATSSFTSLTVSGNTNLATASGNVGIGTTSPSQLLSVGGNTYITGGLGVGIATTTSGVIETTGVIAVGGTGTSTFANGINLTAGCYRLPNGSCAGDVGSGGGVSAGTANRLAYYSASTAIDSANYLTVDTTNSRLGIGTSTRSSVLELYGTSTLATFQSAVNSANAFRILNAATSTVLVFDTTNTRLGISTSTPAQTLSVGGSGYLTGGLGVGIATTTSGALETSGPGLIAGAFNVTGVSTFNSNANFPSGVTITCANCVTDANVIDSLTISGGTIDNTPIGQTTAAAAVFTNATSTNATSTTLAVTSFATTSQLQVSTGLGIGGTPTSTAGALQISGPGQLGTSLSVAGASTILGNVSLGQSSTQTLTVNATSTFANGLTLSTGGLSVTGTGGLSVTNNLNLGTGSSYRIAGAEVLNATTLGSGVTGSSLTGVGTLSNGAISSGFGAIDIGTDALTAGATSLTTLSASGLSTLSGGILVNNSTSTIINLITIFSTSTQATTSYLAITSNASTSNLLVSNGLGVGVSTTTSGNLETRGAALIGGAFNVTGVSTFNSNANFPSGVTITCANCVTDANVIDSLTISGGTIDNTPIGQTTAAAAVFTNATSTNATSTTLAVTSFATTSQLQVSTGLGIGGTPTSTAGAIQLSGPAQLGGALSVAGASTILGNINLGDNSADVLTVTATSTFAGGGVTVSAGGLSVTGTGGLSVTNNLNLGTGSGYRIAGTEVLNATTLGSGVTGSSLTSVGTLGTGSISSGFGAIDIGADALTAGATSLTTLSASGLSTLSGGILVNNSTSTITNLVMVNSTSTQATSTFLAVSTLASTSRLIVSTGLGVGVSTSTTGVIQTSGVIVVGGTGTSTFANGINLTSGCFKLPDGTCAGAGGSGTVNSGTAGFLAYYPSTGTTVDDAGALYWDNTNSRLGIGTTSPVGQLSIEMGTQEFPFWVGDTGTSTPAFVVRGNGNVGIGTASPSGKLNIQDLTNAVNEVLRLTNDNLVGTGSEIQFADDVGSDLARIQSKIEDANSNSLRFFTFNNGTTQESLTILDGNVGIGTTSPTSFLSIDGFNGNGAAVFNNSLGAGGAAGGFRLSGYGSNSAVPPEIGYIDFEMTNGTIGSETGEINFGTTNSGTRAERMTINADGTVSVTGQISSSLAGGTAPLAVVSTTKVTNLNADLLDGSDSSAFGDATAANQTTILNRIGQSTDATTTYPTAPASLFAGIKGLSLKASKSQEFTSSGTFTPSGSVTLVWVTLVGGGGGGSGGLGGLTTSAAGGAGGGSGGTLIRFPVAVSGNVTVTVGAGGAGAAGGSAGSAGEASSFGSVSVAGGAGGTAATASVGGNGGAGGLAPGGTGGAGGNGLGNAGGAGSVGSTGDGILGGAGAGGGGGNQGSGGGQGVAGGAGAHGWLNVGGSAGAAGAGAYSGSGGGGGGSTVRASGGAGGAGGNSTGGGTGTAGANGTAAAANTGAGGGGGGGGGYNNTSTPAASTGGAGGSGYIRVEWIE